MALPRDLDPASLRDVLDALLAEGGRVVFRRHAFDRMEERDITSAQVMQVLRRGDVVAGPWWNAGHRNWNFTLRADTAGELVTIGAALDVDPLIRGQIIVVITVFA